MANTVSLCMICKNEKNNIGNLMDDVCPVLEEVHITDTGSTDGTLEILAEKQKKYSNLYIHHFDWIDHFSAARNYSFTKAGNVDWIFWLDSDDRIDSNALKSFKDTVLDNPSVDCWLLPYIYSKYPDGSPQTYLTRERFLRKNKNPIWIGAIHETVAIHAMRQNNYENLKVEHNRDGKFIEPKRNLRILEKEFEKNPNDPRTAYYYAKELFDHIDPRAKEKLIHFINLKCEKYWDDEISARFRLAKQYVSERDYRAAIQTIEFVYHLDGTRRRSEFYYIYGEVEFALRNFEIAIDWYKRCLYTPPGPPRVLALEYWTWNPMKKIAECYKELGKWDEVFEYVEKIEKILPGDIGTKVWVDSLQSYKLLPKNNFPLAILEFGTELRPDSYKVNKENFKVGLGNQQGVIDWVLNRKLPFISDSIDGVVFNSNIFKELSVEEIVRIVKPCGFLWSIQEITSDKFNYLGVFKYNNTHIHMYVKIDETKQSIGYRDQLEAINFGGYRYRIHNLIMSAKKKGYPVFDITRKQPTKELDIFIDMLMDKKYGAKLNILEFCEKLDNYNCNVDNADILDACSPELAKYLKSKYPGKIVINVDDHFEMPNEGWL